MALSQTTATVEVADGTNGSPVPGEDVTLTSSDPNQVISSVTDEHNGEYTATITSSTTAGAATITAEDVSAGLQATTTLTSLPGPPASLSLLLSPTQIKANGTATTTATVTVLDAHGNQEITGGEAIGLASTDPNQAIGPVTDNGNGTYSATITASTTPGVWTITATDSTEQPALSTTQTLTTPGSASHISVTLQNAKLPADGQSITLVTATVNDAIGTPITGDDITFTSTDPGQVLGSVTDNGDGTYSALLVASTTAGTSTITATDSSVTPHLTGSATLTQTAGPPAELFVEISPKTIDANGTSTATAIMVVEDRYGNPDGTGGNAVQFTSSDPRQVISSVTDHHDGIYSVLITASRTAGPSTITATDTTLGLTGITTLDQLSLAPVPAFTDRLSQSHSRWLEHAEKQHQRTPPVGTTFTVTVDQSSRVTLTFIQATSGRRSSRRKNAACAAASSRNRKFPRCIRLIPAGTLLVAAHAGANPIPFAGKLPHTGMLKPGTYRVTATATNAAGATVTSATLTFTVASEPSGQA